MENSETRLERTELPMARLTTIRSRFVIVLIGKNNCSVGNIEYVIWVYITFSPIFVHQFYLAATQATPSHPKPPQATQATQATPSHPKPPQATPSHPKPIFPLGQYTRMCKKRCKRCHKGLIYFD